MWVEFDIRQQDQTGNTMGKLVKKEKEDLQRKKLSLVKYLEFLDTRVGFLFSLKETGAQRG